MTDFINSITLLFILLNPFLLIIYLIELVQDLNLRVFSSVLARGGIIASGVHITFALLGDAIFTDVLRAEFASFQIFGGIVFLVVGINFMLKGTMAIEALRGPPEHIAGSIAMPILVGPATVSASVLMGQKLSWPMAVLGVLTAVLGTVAMVIALKILHDRIKPRHESLIQRYIEITGRITALLVGIFAVEMIMQGITVWTGRILGTL